MASLPVAFRVDVPLNGGRLTLDARSDGFRLLLAATIPFRQLAGCG
jgi:hypothetical protein